MNEFMMTPAEIREKIDNMEWSFSRVNSIGQCLYKFYLHYIEGQEERPNAFNQYGNFFHEILEKILLGDLSVFEAPSYYAKYYPDRVTCDFPPNKYVDLGEKRYKLGLDYLNNLCFDFKRYEILGVEKELKFKVDKYPFKGYADAVYRDRETGEIILRDHKTSSFTYLKNGSVSSKDRKHFLEFLRQEYLYCIPLIEEYGKVDYLTWHMILDQREIRVPFNEAEFIEAQEWAKFKIQTVEKELMWLPNSSNSYFCNVLCGINGCTYRQ